MKFSIITITYNRADLIGETIQSVLDQSYQNYELIIIDDGSTDNTEDIVNTYKKKSSNKIQYIKNKHTGTPSILRNIGLQNATGELISILDSDDIWLKDKLQETYNVFKNHPEVVFMFHNLRHFFSDVNSPTPPYYNYQRNFYKNITKELIMGDILAFPVFTMRSSLINDIGLFDEDIVEGQHDYYIKVSLLHNIYYLDNPLTLMRRHKGNYTKNFDVIHMLDALKTYNNLYHDKKMTRKLHLLATNFLNFKIAKYFFSVNDLNQGMKYLNVIFKHNSIFNKWYIKSWLLKQRVS